MDGLYGMHGMAPAAAPEGAVAALRSLAEQAAARSCLCHRLADLLGWLERALDHEETGEALRLLGEIEAACPDFFRTTLPRRRLDALRAMVRLPGGVQGWTPAVAALGQSLVLSLSNGVSMPPAKRLDRAA